MKKNRFALLIFLLISASPAFAAQQEVNVAVKGMVCGFCAQGIEKKFKAQSAVEKVKVNLGEKQVKLTLKDGQNLGDDVITQILKDSGYNVGKVERR